MHSSAFYRLAAFALACVLGLVCHASLPGDLPPKSKSRGELEGLDTEALPAARPLIACGSHHSYLYDGKTITRFTVYKDGQRTPAKKTIERIKSSSNVVITSMDCSADGRSFAYIYVERPTLETKLKVGVAWVLNGEHVSIRVADLEQSFLDQKSKVSLPISGNSLIIRNPHKEKCRVVLAKENLCNQEVNTKFGIVIKTELFAGLDRRYDAVWDTKILAIDPHNQYSSIRSKEGGIQTFASNPNLVEHPANQGFHDLRVINLAVSRPYTVAVCKHRSKVEYAISVFDTLKKTYQLGAMIPNAEEYTNLALQTRVRKVEVGPGRKARDIVEFAYHLVPEGVTPVQIITSNPRIIYRLGSTPGIASVSKDAKLAMKFEWLPGEEHKNSASKEGLVTIYRYLPMWSEGLNEKEMEFKAVETPLPIRASFRHVLERAAGEEDKQKASPAVKPATEECGSSSSLSSSPFSTPLSLASLGTLESSIARELTKLPLSQLEEITKRLQALNYTSSSSLASSPATLEEKATLPPNKAFLFSDAKARGLKDHFRAAVGSKHFYLFARRHVDHYKLKETPSGGSAYEKQPAGFFQVPNGAAWMPAMDCSADGQSVAFMYYDPLEKPTDNKIITKWYYRGEEVFLLDYESPKDRRSSTLALSADGKTLVLGNQAIFILRKDRAVLDVSGGSEVQFRGFQDRFHLSLPQKAASLSQEPHRLCWGPPDRR